MVVVLFRWCTRSKQRSGYSEGTRALEKSVLITMIAVFIKAFFTIVMITITISTMKFKFTWSNGLETEEEEVPDHVLVVVVQPVVIVHPRGGGGGKDGKGGKDDKFEKS